MLSAEMQAIATFKAGEHSFELQDCAKHVHSKLTQLANSLCPSPSTTSDTAQMPANKVMAVDADNDKATDAAASRRAQSKARQVAGCVVVVTASRCFQSAEQNLCDCATECLCDS